jgi:carbamoylphosphate synthase large subunit
LRILILGTSSPQIDALKFLKSKGYTTYACSNIKLNHPETIIDHFFLIDILNEEALIELIYSKDIKIIYSVGSDIAMPIISAISEKLDLTHFISSTTAEICNNKGNMRLTLGSQFSGNISFKIIDNLEDMHSMKYPIVLKPVDSQGQRGVRMIKHHSELLLKFEESKRHSRSGKLIAETYLTGDEYSANGYFVDGELKLCLLSDRIVWEGFDGGLIHKHLLPSKKISEEVARKVEDLLVRISKKLQINNGPIYLQFKIQDDMPFIIEVAPRLDGCHLWLIIKEYCNVDLIKLIFEHLIDNRTDELANFLPNNSSYMLEFICDYPNKKVNFTKYDIPDDTIMLKKYYNGGDTIRPVNNQYEKIGYFIRNINTTENNK